MKPIVIGLVALVLLVGGYGLFAYLWPKITLFDPRYRVERFRSMERVFPAVTVHPRSGAAALPEAPREIVQSYEYDGELRDLDAFLRRSATTALVVVHRGKIVHERYFQGNGPGDRVASFSVAKSFVATLVSIAHEDGLITALSDPITDYLPELRGTGFDGVPIEAVLQMSSGVDFSEIYGDESTDAYTIFNKLFLHLRPMGRVIGDFGSKQPHGSTFDYASINTQALGMLVERVTGQPIAAYLEARLWQPLGMQDEARWLTDLYGNALAFWGLNATARDFARLGMLYAQNGRFDGQQILTPAAIARATTAHRADLQRGQIEGDWGYGHHWWLPRAAAHDFAAIGIWGQFIYVDPINQTVIVKFSADPDFKPHEYEAIASFRAIAAAL